MRIQQDDHDDIRELVEHGASSWHGPSPFAEQSRWAAAAAPRRPFRTAALVAGLALAALAAGSAGLVAAAQSPNGAAASMIRLVSHVFTGPPGGPFAGAAPSPSPSPVPSVTPSPSGAPPATSRARFSPPPAGWHERGDGRPSPAPSGSPLPSPIPSASPSRPPDE